MKKQRLCFLLLLLIAFQITDAQKNINRVRFMPDAPSPYQMRDWKQVAKDYDDFIFSFKTDGLHFPLIKWDDVGANFKGRSFNMVSYIGAPGGNEGINNLAAIVGATLVGIDKSNQNGINYVEMCQKWFNSDNGINIFGNRTNESNDWNRLCDWYSTMPNILAFQLNYLYPKEIYLHKEVLMVADFFLNAPEKLAREDRAGTRNPNMQRDFGGAIAWMEYMAYTMTDNVKYLKAADTALQYTLNSPNNPLYEMLLPYAAYVATRLNAEQGRTYDVPKLLNWCFDGDAMPRHGWGVIADRWNGYDMHGLQGSITDGGGYAFAMNTFQMAGALTPLVRYDKSLAKDIGKWMLHVANNARMFYANAYDAAHQSNYKWALAYDKNSAVAYEGIRKWKRGSDKAIADYKTLSGKVIKGDFRATHFLREIPALTEDIRETKSLKGTRLEHVWEVELPEITDKWLVVSGEKVAESPGDNGFVFSISDKPNGSFSEVFTVREAKSRPSYVKIPDNFKRLFVKVSSTETSSFRNPEILSVDAISVTYQTNISPFATGDFVVSFVDLIDNYTVPIVMYRPEDAATDLGLYGSSHVGILGGIVTPTNVEKILQLDLLKTDYYHADAYPSYLYYNPWPEAKDVAVAVGNSEVDIYNTVTSSFISKNVSGTISITIPAKSASILVIVPAGGTVIRSHGRTLVNGRVIDFGTI